MHFFNIIYLGTAEGDFKKRYCNHIKSFRNKRYTNDTSLSNYIWKIKEKHQENPSLKWSIVKMVPAYSYITKNVFYAFMKNWKLLITRTTEKLSNKRSELVSKCRHASKYLLNNCIAND